MGRLERYLSGNYIKEKDEQKSVVELIKKVIPTYERFHEGKGWGYKLGESAKDMSISTSTVSMVAFSMSVLICGKPDLAIDGTRKDILSYYKKLKAQENFMNVFRDSLKVIFDTFRNGTEKEAFTFESTTYGIDDPFTLMWARYLIDNNKDILKEVVEDFEEVEKEFNNKCENIVGEIFESLYEDKANLKFPPQIEKFHIFPLLKTVQLYSSMISTIEDKIDENYINEVRNTLKNSLHNHLSLVSIENSNFDTAELVFSLEGLLLLDPNRDNFDQNLLNRVFQVVRERQDISIYWRPLKPFVINQQGLALLPLSIEIAMSLIRICRLLGKRGEKLFSKNYNMFHRYTDWLKTGVTVVPCSKKNSDECETKQYCSWNKCCSHKKFYGWCSEHVYQPNVIHTWETSQVMVYLVNFADMLQKHISYQSLKFANLSSKDCSSEKSLWEKWEKTELISQPQFEIYKPIKEHYINVDERNNCYSMLLYGPPGTGKSTIAEQIAKAKGWPLVTITPSDFITSGADQVETKAKSIFKVLEEQDEMVVIFDEIDRLILDRDSSLYHAQSDLFQFMTPSMLVKLKDLRTKGKIIFIIATNYEGRIDKAIKRKGRIDNLYLVLPHDMGGRKKLFEKLIIKKLDPKVQPKFEECEELILRKTALFTYTEFDQLSDIIQNKSTELITGGKVNKEELKKLIEKPSITLMSYSKKLGLTEDEKNFQKPIKEFLSLVFLKAETYDCIGNDSPVFDKNELELLVEFLASKEMLDIKATKNVKGNFDKLVGHEKDIKLKLDDYISKDMADKIIAALISEISKIKK